jgi:hypothetical protein
MQLEHQIAQVSPVYALLTSETSEATAVTAQPLRFSRSLAEKMLVDRHNRRHRSQ